MQIEPGKFEPGQFAIVQIEVGMLQNFNELIIDPDTREAAVVDPAYEVDRLLRIAKEHGVRITTVLVTHTHPDHIDGVAEMVAATGAVVRVGSGEAQRVRDQAPEAKIVAVADGERVAIGKRFVTAMATPGHTIDGRSYLAGDAIITGDTLFVGGCGRSDFPGGNAPILYESLRKLAELPEETRVYPGHDYGQTPTSTIATELDSNPYMRCRTVEEFVEMRTGKNSPKPTRGPR